MASNGGAESSCIVNYDLNWEIDGIERMPIKKFSPLEPVSSAEFSIYGIGTPLKTNEFNKFETRRYSFYIKTDDPVVEGLRVQFQTVIRTVSSECQTTDKEMHTVSKSKGICLLSAFFAKTTLRIGGEILPFRYDFLSLKCHFKFFMDPVVPKADILPALCVPLKRGFTQLCSDYKSLYDSKEMADVTITIGEDSLLAHKLVLVARSPVFKAMLGHDFLESSTRIIQITDIDRHVFDCFLKYLYYSEISDTRFDTVRDLYVLADKYAVVCLKDDCRDILDAGLKLDTACKLLELAEFLRDEGLKQKVVEFIKQHFSEVSKRKEWLKICKDYPELASYVLGMVTEFLSFLDKSR